MEAVDVSGDLDVLKSESADEKLGASQRRKVFITDDPNPLPRTTPQRSIYTSDLDYQKSLPPKPPKPLYLPDHASYPAAYPPHYGYPPVINYSHPSSNLVRPGLYAGHPPYPYPAMQTMAMNVSSTSAKEWVQKQKDKLQPWQEFLNSSKVSKPRSASALYKRIPQNLEKFQSNYLLVSVGLFVYCIITSPLLLVACAFLIGGCYFIQARQSAGKVVLLGRELTVGQQYLALALVSIPIFFMAGAGSAVFWVIGASVFLILVHASLLSTDAVVVEEQQPELTMETV